MADTATIATPKGQHFEVGIISDRYSVGQDQFVPIYDDRAIPFVARLFQERVDDEFDCIVLMTGPRRTGKSTLILQLGPNVSEDFSIKDVAFRIEEFNQIIARNPFADPSKKIYPQAHQDEAGFDLFSQNWMDRVQRNMVRKFEVIGAKRQIVYLALPHRCLLNRALRESMPHYWIDVTTFEGKRGVAELREGKHSKWRLEMFWKPLCVFTFKPLAGDLWDEYTKKKMVFIEEVCKAQELDQSERLKVAWSQRDRAICMLRKTAAMTDQEIGDALGISRTTVVHIGMRSRES